MNNEQVLISDAKTPHEFPPVITFLAFHIAIMINICLMFDRQSVSPFNAIHPQMPDKNVTQFTRWSHSETFSLF